LANILSKMKFSTTKNPSDYLEEIALRHRQLRKDAGWSQSEMAERSGVSLGSLKRFERTGQISLESLLKLMHLLDRLDDVGTLLKPKENQRQIEKLFSDKTRRK
jgi:transcriptional regulator with XRE-family HTH domain